MHTLPAYLSRSTKLKTSQRFFLTSVLYQEYFKQKLYTFRHLHSQPFNKIFIFNSKSHYGTLHLNRWQKILPKINIQRQLTRKRYKIELWPTYNGRPIRSRIMFYRMAHFQWPWTTLNLDFKVVPLFDAECLRNGTRFKRITTEY